MTAPQQTAAAPVPKRWQRVLAVLFIAALGLAIVANGVIASWKAVHDFAVRIEIPAPEQVATGFEAALLVIVSWDIVLSWMRCPVPLLRWMARVLTVLSVVVNAAAGWPVLRAMLLYLPAPLTVLAIVESTRHVLLARHRQREPIPFARWVLHYKSSRELQRLMVKWEITSYRAALEMHQRIEHAKKLLETAFGMFWQREAGADLVWMLNEGVMLEDAIPRVYRLVEAKGVESGQGGRGRGGDQDRGRNRKQDNGRDKRQDYGQDNQQDNNVSRKGRAGQADGAQDNGQAGGQDTGGGTQTTGEKLSAAKPDAVLIKEWRMRWVTNPGRPTITTTYAIGNDRAYRLIQEAWPEQAAHIPSVNGTSH